MRVECNDYGPGTPTQVNLLGSNVPRASYGTLRQGFTDCSGSFMPSIVQEPRPKNHIFLRQFQEELKVMGPCHWAWAQGPFGSWDLSAVHYSFIYLYFKVISCCCICICALPLLFFYFFFINIFHIRFVVQSFNGDGSEFKAHIYFLFIIFSLKLYQLFFPKLYCKE